MKTVSISSTVKSHPVWPYEDMKNTILGKKYQLSLTFIGSARAQKLNIEHRNKEYVPNVLSFPLTDAVGEIFICPAVSDKEAKNFDLSPRGYIAFLFIHGLLHLKGLPHGDTMGTQEQKYLRKFNIS